MMYVVATQDGEVRVLRTIVTSACVLGFICISFAQSSAQSYMTGAALVSHNLDSEIGTYKKTPQRLGKVLNELNLESASYVYRSRYNGFSDRRHYNRHRDTALIVPAEAVPQDLTLVVWFHGLGGFSEKTFRRVLRQVKALTKAGHSVAVSIPEMPWSTNTNTKRSRQGRVWEYPGDFSNFISESKDKLDGWARSNHNTSISNLRIVIVGHSAGGSAISSAAQEGGLCDVAPSNIIWSDASYGFWLNQAWDGCLSNLDTKIQLLVRKWDKPHVRASNFLKSTKLEGLEERIDYQVLDRKRYRHGDIGDNALILSEAFVPGC